MATADLTVLALGRPDPSASEYIAEIQRRLAAQDRVRYRMHAMGTSLEGSTEDILATVGELHAVPFELGVPRVYTVLKLDERRDSPVRRSTTRCAPSRSASSRPLAADGVDELLLKRVEPLALLEQVERGRALGGGSWFRAAVAMSRSASSTSRIARSSFATSSSASPGASSSSRSALISARLVRELVELPGDLRVALRLGVLKGVPDVAAQVRQALVHGLVSVAELLLVALPAGGNRE